MDTKLDRIPRFFEHPRQGGEMQVFVCVNRNSIVSRTAFGTSFLWRPGVSSSFHNCWWTEQAGQGMILAWRKNRLMKRGEMSNQTGTPHVHESQI
jgi:hypothetical protein